MLGGHGFRRPPRPVEPSLAAALADRSGEITKRWLMELVERTPLAQTSGAVLEEISALGADRVGAVVAALADDVALERLGATGFELAVGTATVTTLRSLDALQAAVWGMALEHVRGGAAQEVAELAERLTAVMEALRADALRGARGTDIPRDAGNRDMPARPTAPVTRGSTSSSQEHVRLAARLREASSTPLPDSSRAAQSRRTGASAVNETASPAEDAKPGSDADGSPPFTAEEHGAGELKLEGPGWVRALEEEIRRARLAAQRLALILIELEDTDRLQMSASSAQELEVLLGRFVNTIRPLLRGEDILALESWGRAWIISPATGRFTARLIGGGVADELASSGEWHGAPLRASAGIAVLGEDGDDAEALVDVAEQERFEAAARGLAVVAPETPSA